MKKICFLFAVGFLLLATPLFALDKGPLLDVINKMATGKFSQWAKNPVVINAVKEANLKANRSFEEIAKIDQLWINNQGADEWINSFRTNNCALFLKSQQTQTKSGRLLFPEIFVMDKQGCIVAETNKTSDFLQGDEDKFINSFANGKGKIFIDEATFDDSSLSYSVQVSVPVFDPQTGSAIGALTVSVDLDAVGEQLLQ